MLTSSSWEKIHATNSWGSDTDSASANQLAFIRHHLQEIKGAPRDILLLDVGCGTGGSAISFAGMGYQVYGVDSSASAIEIAKKKSCENGGGCTFSVADFKELPYQSNWFDAIFAQGSLYYGTASDFMDAVSEIYRVMKRGGCLRIYTKSDRDMWAKVGIPQGDDCYLVDSDNFENGLVVYCPPLEKISTLFSNFSEIKIGIEEFNYVSLDAKKMHSFWCITAIK